MIALFDVTALKSSTLRDVNARIARGIVETVREPLLVLDGSFQVRFANRSFHRLFRIPSGEAENRSLFELGDGEWDIPRLRSLLEDVLPRKTAFRDFRVSHDFPGIGRKTLLLNARRIGGKEKEPAMILLAIEEVDGRTRGRRRS